MAAVPPGSAGFRRRRTSARRSAARPAAGVGIASAPGSTSMPGPQLLDRPDRDPLVRLEPVLDHAQAVVLQRPGRHPAVLGPCSRRRSRRRTSAPGRTDGPVDHQHGRVRLADRQADADEHARATAAAGRSPASGWRTRRGRRCVPVVGLTTLLTKLIVPGVREARPRLRGPCRPAGRCPSPRGWIFPWLIAVRMRSRVRSSMSK